MRLPIREPRPSNKFHLGVLQPWIAERRCSGVSAGTINHGLQIVRRILNLAVGEWMDEQSLTWLQAAPKIKAPQSRQAMASGCWGIPFGSQNHRTDTRPLWLDNAPYFAALVASPCSTIAVA